MNTIMRSFAAAGFDLNTPGPDGELPFLSSRESPMFDSLLMQQQLRQGTEQPLAVKEPLAVKPGRRF